MPPPMNLEHEKARELWLQSDGEMSIPELANRLGIKPATVRAWKSREGWVDQLEEQLAAKGKTLDDVPRRAPAGGIKPPPPPPRGNQRAKGHGAPVGNKNGLRHGVFEAFAYQYMDEDEKEIAYDVSIDCVESELLNVLAFLKARELRLMKRIAKVREMGERQKEQMLTSTTKLKSEKRMGLWTGSSEAGYVKQEGTGMYDGEWLDETTTNTPSIEEALTRLEAELSKVQAQKVRILTQLDTMKTTREHLEIERIRAQGENEQSKLANDWVEALLQLYADNADGGDQNG